MQDFPDGTVDSRPLIDENICNNDADICCLSFGSTTTIFYDYRL